MLLLYVTRFGINFFNWLESKSSFNCFMLIMLYFLKSYRMPMKCARTSWQLLQYKMLRVECLSCSPRKDTPLKINYGGFSKTRIILKNLNYLIEWNVIYLFIFDNRNKHHHNFFIEIKYFNRLGITVMETICFSKPFLIYNIPKD